MAFLRAKQDAGATRAISQFFFDPEVFLRFTDRARAAGIRLPILPGIMLQPNFAGLKRIAGLCGASLPDWLHARYDGTEEDPPLRDRITADLAAELCQRLQAEGINHFHFYTLNRAELTLDTCGRLGLHPDQETTE
jgi:methylenetetrahydrofolate reductase (NADPH)